MFDLTIQLEKESDTIYRDVCLKIKEAASEPPLQSVLRYNLLICQALDTSVIGPVLLIGPWENIIMLCQYLIFYCFRLKISLT